MNCKPNDLAIVINDEFLQNIGKIVRVLGPGFQYDWDNRFHWECELERPAPVTWDGSATVHEYHTVCDIPDECLRPFSGIPDTEDTDIKQPIWRAVWAT